MKKRIEKDIIKDAVPQLSSKNVLEVDKDYVWLPTSKEAYQQFKAWYKNHEHCFVILPFNRSKEGHQEYALMIVKDKWPIVEEKL
jgi:hypothetical protein